MRSSPQVSTRHLLLRGLIAGVCTPFVASGFVKLSDLTQASREVAGLGMDRPEAIALAIVSVQLGGSLLAILFRGGWAALGALVLAGFTVFSTLPAHPFWTLQGAARIGELNTFAEHVSIVFALLIVAWGHANSMGLSLRRFRLVQRAGQRGAFTRAGDWHEARR